MATYKETLEKNIPRIIEECSEPNWDSYNSVPISKVAIDKAISILKRLEQAGMECPIISPCPDGDVDLEWDWHKGDWRVPVEKQERYAWTIIISVSEKAIDGEGDCMFFENDARNGVSKKDSRSFHLYFNYQDEFPKEMLEKLKSMEEFRHGQPV